MEDTQRKEWEAWTAMCDLLLKTGAITVADGMASAHDQPTTDGTRLFAAIRKWGEALVEARLTPKS